LDPLALGLTLAVAGIGGTLVVLTGFGLIAALLKRLFPLEAAAEPTPATRPAQS
jgi:hypothetical protein